MLTAAVGPRLIARFGRARMMWASLGILSVGVLVFASCNVVVVTICGALIAGLGGTLVINIATTILTAHHAGAAGGAAVTQANGFSAGCGIVAPLLVGGAVSIGVGWRAGLVVTVVFAAVVVVVFARRVRADDGSRRRPSRGRIPKVRRLSREYWRACFVIVMTNAIEFSMTIWSSDVLHHHDGLSKGTAATGVTAIVTGMTVGRLSSGRLTLRYSSGTSAVVGVRPDDHRLRRLLGIGKPGDRVRSACSSLGLGISLQYPLAITTSGRILRRSARSCDGVRGTWRRVRSRCGAVRSRRTCRPRRIAHRNDGGAGVRRCWARSVLPPHGGRRSRCMSPSRPRRCLSLSATCPPEPPHKQQARGDQITTTSAAHNTQRLECVASLVYVCSSRASEDAASEGAGIELTNADESGAGDSNEFEADAGEEFVIGKDVCAAWRRRWS